MKDCICSPEHNIVMLLCDMDFTCSADMDFTQYWVECDFCGNKTAKWDTEEIAIFKWNEFQYKRRVNER